MGPAFCNTRPLAAGNPMTEDNQKFVSQIEEMGDQEVRQQQEEVWEREMPDIRTLDCVSTVQEQVTYEFPELTAVCPMTGLPDFYRLRLVYRPDDRVPELKSFRFYLLSYRDVPVLHEHLAGKIYRDFVDAVKPAEAAIQLNVAVRGGITTTVRAGELPLLGEFREG